jgi:hypothetical protein
MMVALMFPVRVVIWNISLCPKVSSIARTYAHRSLFVRFCDVFRYEWWVLTAAQEIVTAESLGFINGAKQLVWEIAGVRKVIRTADESNRAGP